MREPTLRSHKMRCPLCGKRIFDISGLPGEQIAINLKCPSCHQVVTVRCSREAMLRFKARPMTKAITCKATGIPLQRRKKP